jgi:hypothetical protein
MFTFSTPCLKWKLLVAVKYQYGFPGFTAPYNTRYLTQTITETQTFPGSSTSYESSTTIDRITGAATSTVITGGLTDNFVFPYGQDLTGTTYVVGGDDNYSFTFTKDDGYILVTVNVQLSNPYNLAQLDADADTLLATIDPATMAWNTLQEVFYDIFGPADAGIPAQYGYGGATGGAISQLNAAAWSWLSLGDVSSVTYYPNAYSKLISYVAMAGNYCQKTLTFDYNNNLINQSCLSGVGACSAPFKVVPPPLAAGQNSVVLIVPNCQCSGS